MKKADDRRADQWLRRTAAQFVYPPAPDVRARVRAAIGVEDRERQRSARRSRPRRRAFAWALFAILLLAASLLLVPQVRASVLQLLRAGGITIFVSEAKPTAVSQVLAVPTLQSNLSPTPASSAATVAATQSPSFLLPVTPVTLSQAVRALPEPAALPSSLRPFGAPQEVYVDDEANANVAILVWNIDDGRRLLLYAIAARDFATKQVQSLTTTMVNGEQAYWIEGPHGFVLRDGDVWDTETSTGSVLIWTVGDLTYRLQGAASLEEARAFAEALQS